MDVQGRGINAFCLLREAHNIIYNKCGRRNRPPIITRNVLYHIIKIVSGTFKVTDRRVSFQDNLPIATLKNVCLVSIERNCILCLLHR